MSPENITVEEHELHLILPGNVRAVLTVEDGELTIAMMAVTDASISNPDGHHPLCLLAAPVAECRLAERSDIDRIPNRIAVGDRCSLVVENDEAFRAVEAWLGTVAA